MSEAESQWDRSKRPLGFNATYSRARCMAMEAAKALATRFGTLRERFKAIDTEFFFLPPDQLPDDSEVRRMHAELESAVSTFPEGRHVDGSFQAMLAEETEERLMELAGIIWDLNRRFCALSASDAVQDRPVDS